MKDYTTITSPEIAFERLGREFKMPDLSLWPDRHKKYALADFLLVAIFEACNLLEDGKPWEPNYNDHKQKKWEPWMVVNADEENPSGIGFVYSDYNEWRNDVSVGARFCCREKDILEHICNTFTQLLIDRQLFTVKRTV